MHSLMIKAPSKFLWIFGLILYLYPVAIVFMEPEGLAPEWMLVSTIASVLGGILLVGYGLWWAIKKCLDFVAVHFSRTSNID